MRLECRERFSRHRLQRKPLVSDPGMHRGTFVTHVPWCMSGSLTRDGGKNVPVIPGACPTRNFSYLARGPWNGTSWCMLKWLGNFLCAFAAGHNGMRVLALNVFHHTRNFHYLHVYQNNWVQKLLFAMYILVLPTWYLINWFSLLTCTYGNSALYESLILFLSKP